jgi:hypothetical protein
LFLLPSNNNNRPRRRSNSLLVREDNRPNPLRSQLRQARLLNLLPNVNNNNNRPSNDKRHNHPNNNNVIIILQITTVEQAEEGVQFRMQLLRLRVSNVP